MALRYDHWKRCLTGVARNGAQLLRVACGLSELSVGMAADLVLYDIHQPRLCTACIRRNSSRGVGVCVSRYRFQVQFRSGQKARPSS